MLLTRRLALAALATAAVSAACGTAERASSPVVAGFVDDLAGAPDGPLPARTTSTGHRWAATGAGTDQPPVVYREAIGPPPDHVPGSTGAADAGYAVAELGVPASRVGAEFRWDSSPSTASGLTLGALTWPATGIPDSRPTTDPRHGSSMHLALSPLGAQFAVFSRGTGGDFTVLGSVGDGADVFPMRCDGRTTYRVEIVRDGDRVTVVLDDAEPVTFRDPRIGSLPARFPFREYYSMPGGTNLPRFTRVWAG